MSWMAKLYETYEAVMALDLSDEAKLTPISHTLQNAHINIVIDGEGNFRRASVIEKTQIILPATENRQAEVARRPLHTLWLISFNTWLKITLILAGRILFILNIIHCWQHGVNLSSLTQKHSRC